MAVFCRKLYTTKQTNLKLINIYGRHSVLYGRKKNINVTFEEISKINFPVKRELNELKKKFMDSYVMK